MFDSTNTYEYSERGIAKENIDLKEPVKIGEKQQARVIMLQLNG